MRLLHGGSLHGKQVDNATFPRKAKISVEGIKVKVETAFENNFGRPTRHTECDILNSNSSVH